MIYDEIILSKTNKEIPLFKNGHSLHSKYNPEREAQNFASTIKSSFIVIVGIGAGFFIEEVANQNPNSKIIGVEADRESLEFCLKFPTNQKLLQKDNIVFCSIEELEQNLYSFLPAIYTTFSLNFVNQWKTENKEKADLIVEMTERTIKNIKADFSVQSQFGKIWQRNILLNLKSFNKIKNSSTPLDTSKIAAVVAAGPSLDLSLVQIKNNPEKYYVIATDTTFGTLVKQGIKVDAVVSIDSQNISHTHFFESSKDDTLYVFDLCGNNDAVNFCISHNKQIEFVKNNHPLCLLADKNEIFPLINSYSGTVTIACCDWAKSKGFTKIQLFGADFAYSFGKAYCKGTYLDSNFGTISCKTANSETLFTKLMYRTELNSNPDSSSFGTKLSDSYTNDVLLSYKNGLFQWAKDNSFELKNNIFTRNSPFEINTSKQNFDYNQFINDFTLNLENLSKTKDFLNSPYFLAILPFISSLKKSDNFSEKQGLEHYVKLAHKHCKGYN